MFYDSASDFLRVAIIGTLAYLSLIFLLRLTGKRTPEPVR